jgi:hypothetical protein
MTTQLNKQYLPISYPTSCNLWCQHRIPWKRSCCNFTSQALLQAHRLCQKYCLEVQTASFYWSRAYYDVCLLNVCEIVLSRREDNPIKKNTLKKIMLAIVSATNIKTHDRSTSPHYRIYFYSEARRHDSTPIINYMWSLVIFILASRFFWMRSSSTSSWLMKFLMEP